MLCQKCTKPRNHCGYRVLLELLGRFELPTSSLPTAVEPSSPCCTRLFGGFLSKKDEVTACLFHCFHPRVSPFGSRCGSESLQLIKKRRQNIKYDRADDCPVRILIMMHQPVPQSCDLHPRDMPCVQSVSVIIPVLRHLVKKGFGFEMAAVLLISTQSSPHLRLRSCAGRRSTRFSLLPFCQTASAFRPICLFHTFFRRGVHRAIVFAPLRCPKLF